LGDESGNTVHESLTDKKIQRNSKRNRKNLPKNIETKINFVLQV